MGIVEKQITAETQRRREETAETSSEGDYRIRRLQD
jgi:hypothetical protein